MKLVKATKLNVRSGPGTSFRSLTILTQHAVVRVVEEHDGWSWITPGEGWVASQYLKDPDGKPAGEAVEGGGSTPETPVAPGFPVPPQGLAAIMAEFGPPGGPLASAGIVRLARPLRIGWAPQDITQFRCHKALEATFQSVFDEIDEKDLWHLIETFDGCYNDRTVKNSDKRSTHAWGIGIDLNAAKTAKRGEDQPLELVKVFARHGFVWGGKFPGKSRDPMHWQFAGGY